MSYFSLKSLTFLFFIAFTLWSSSLETCTARGGNAPRGGSKPKPPRKPTPKEVPRLIPHPLHPPIEFEVRHYGAKGDGITDDTEAFQAAWMDACKVVNSAVLVPARFTFLVGPVSFDGSNCQSKILFKLEGKIIAPDPQAWRNGASQWLVFTKLNRGITVTGNGVIDGRGSGWWKKKSTRPTAVRFYGSSDVRVEGITIQNSPRCHLKFDNCKGVEVNTVTASSPPDSPNTDGILLSNSMNVQIHSSELACGCSNVTVENVRCGPGHGISIGSLGEHETKECVSDIIVRDISIHNSTNGVRIKTWQGGSGSVRNVQFSNINVSGVGRPIVINQFYCDGKDEKKCPNKTAAVAVSGITFGNIFGTYTVRPVDLACSDSVPCTDVNLNDIDLNPSTGKEPTLDNAPYCWKASGEMNLTTPMMPPNGGCSKTDKPLNNGFRPDRDVC
ncbi:hypothetical protein V6N13_090397 [Hibiscus sabdariffa]|uniref:Polygalacturonase n=1 Tax=Hibiscus sabdariffa TaxID=183260 RepID=A0ABR2C0N0_9ROSI